MFECLLAGRSMVRSTRYDPRPSCVEGRLTEGLRCPTFQRRVRRMVWSGGAQAVRYVNAVQGRGIARAIVGRMGDLADFRERRSCASS